LVELRGGSKELLGAVNAFAREFTSLGAQRNRFVHDPYGIDERTLEVKRVVVTADKTLRMAIENVTLEEMDLLFGKIQRLLLDFDDLYQRMVAELPSWPRTQYEQSRGIHIRRIDRGNETKARPRRPRSSHPKPRLPG